MNELRGKIVAVYGSLLKFAEAIGWSSRKVYDVVNCNQELTAKDIEQICELLGIEISSDMKRLFFTKKST